MDKHKLRGYCPKCDDDTEFHYVGGQTRIGDKPTTEYYSCSCGTTFTKDNFFTLENIARNFETKKEFIAYEK